MKNKKKLAILCILLILIFALVLRLEKGFSSDPASHTSIPDDKNIVSISPSPETDMTWPSPVSEQPSVDQPAGDQNSVEPGKSPVTGNDAPTDQPINTPSPGNKESQSPNPENSQNEKILPDGFVYIRVALPNAKLEIRYASAHNFTGRVVEGYLSDDASLTIAAASALKKASEALEKAGYGVKIYDAYRPKQAVDFFIKWGEEPEDFKTKTEFYPDYEKKDLFSLGYIAKKSGHSRGSTVDLTIYDPDTGDDIDMGSPFDFLGPISNHGTALITEEQTNNRNILKKAMKDAGFKELRTEWWHYTLINEPYPDTYFDFPVK